MIEFRPKGAIFDVDDTLLDNKAGSPMALHGRSRYAMMREIGERHNIPRFKKWTFEDNHRAFRTAPTHSLLGTSWNSMVMAGLRGGDIPDPKDPLIVEMIATKMRLHENILRKEGKAFPGSPEFVAALVAEDVTVAIGSTAYRSEIDIFLALSGLRDYFAANRIISNESVTRYKPDPEVFDLAFATLGLPETDRPYVPVFEDDPRGIAAAQSAGLYVCAKTTVFSRPELESLNRPPDMVYDDYFELAEKFGLKL